MELIGVTPITDIIMTEKGQKSFKFLTPYSNRVFSSLSYNKFLKKLNKSVIDLILDINKISIDDLPKCRICNKNPVSFCNSRGNSKRIDILNPKLSTSCSNRSCCNSNKSLTRIDKGSHVSQRPKHLRSLLATKANNTKILKGIHVSQKHGHYIELINGIEYSFNSKAEIHIFKRFYRILNKYYQKEKVVSTYGNGSKYIADYVKSSDSPESYPDVIEVKSNSLFFCKYIGSNIKRINYDKFKSVIDCNKSLLIIDYYNDKLTKYFITNINELNKLFNEA